ncbi:MAG: hypothetical protein WBO76_00515 [Saprospiraceae bacterium]
MKRNILIIIGTSIMLKLSYLMFAYTLNGNAEIISINGYIDIIKRNDVGWYERISSNWYPKISDIRDLGYSEGANFKQSEWAFFPFYPGLIRFTSNVLHIPFNISGLLWSLIFSTLTFIGFYWFCELLIKDISKAFYATLIFMIYPFHYYFSMMYTEALFLTFLIYSFIAIYYKKELVLLVLLIPLTLVRPNGIFMVIPLYLFFLETRKGIIYRRIIWQTLITKEIMIRSFIFLMAPICFILYCLYQNYMTGQYFAFSIAQIGWYKKLTFPLLSFFRSGDFQSQFNSMYTLVVCIISIFSFKKISLSLNVLIWLSLLIPLSSGSMISMQRYISVIFPITILVSSYFYQFKFKYAVVAILFALHLFVFSYWLNSNPFSY